MNRPPSGTDIKTGLTADEVKLLAEWFRESYKDDWRPAVYPRGTIERFHTKLAAIYGEAPEEIPT